MYNSFKKLHAEKRDLILQISMEEFAEKGYHKASTDTITQRAGISKGILFHYFKSKKGLFLYLVEHTRDLLEKKVMSEIEILEEGDYFERIKKMMIIKYKVALNYPTETEFAARALLTPPAEAADEIAALNAKYMEKYKEKLMQDFLYDKKLLEKLPLRVDPEKVIKASAFILEQVGAKYIEKYKSQGMYGNFDEFLEELEFFNDIIKYGVIKKNKGCHIMDKY
ncbi:TetR/AcrR family transcriptional regulator [Pelotomaculum isophthalicicum JI]|uniref:TetR/AcrR family transcriptional regulator n=1 Tax=Pelotomaculum isophthalicicum JI TaxID=947010 RepID=A0A9X4H3E6_9FIRM|nr:TetR/AcrR family transcriptional regulator [Pelotomaculum isophthalicicum]MDF9409606.1 TetR/AcrR family transcriptional regulator [Pelotomaculum isophthalicicum JI]